MSIRAFTKRLFGEVGLMGLNPSTKTDANLLEGEIMLAIIRNQHLWLATLAGHAPDWVSVTYRLRTGDKTLELVTRIKRHYHIEAMAHLTCANTADRTR